MRNNKILLTLVLRKIYFFIKELVGLYNVPQEIMKTWYIKIIMGEIMKTWFIKIIMGEILLPIYIFFT